MGLTSDGAGLTVHLRNGEVPAGELVFDGVTAFRFRNELHSLGFIPGSYDRLVEVIESDWLAELAAIEPTRISPSVKECHHFAVLLSNNGYLEVVSEAVELLPAADD
jgi:hypothetical protein